jgi:hypothetical protein
MRRSSVLSFPLQLVFPGFWQECDGRDFTLKLFLTRWNRKRILKPEILDEDGERERERKERG